MRRSTASVQLCILLGALGGVLHAQPAPPTGFQAATSTGVARQVQPLTPAQSLNQLVGVLSLSDVQRAGILPLLQQLQAELATVTSSGMTRTPAAEGKQAFINTTAGQIRALLSPTQQSAFDAIRPTRLVVMLGG